MVNDNWGVYALRLAADGGKPERLWNYRKNVTEISSPLVHDGVFYMVEKGIVTALDASTGELLKRDRIGEGSPKVYASPVAAADRVYFTGRDGTTVVIQPGDVLMSRGPTVMHILWWRCSPSPSHWLAMNGFRHRTAVSRAALRSPRR